MAYDMNSNPMMGRQGVQPFNRSGLGAESTIPGRPNQELMSTLLQRAVALGPDTNMMRPDTVPTQRPDLLQSMNTGSQGMARMGMYGTPAMPVPPASQRPVGSQFSATNSPIEHLLGRFRGQ